MESRKKGVKILGGARGYKSEEVMLRFLKYDSLKERATG